MNKILLLSFAFLGLISFNSCADQSCEIDNEGTVCILNSTSEMLSLDINGSFQGFLQPGQKECYVLGVGDVIVEAETDFFATFQKTWSDTLTLNPCGLVNHNLDN